MTTADTGKLAAAGAEIVAEPTPTPWHSLNSRLEGGTRAEEPTWRDLLWTLAGVPVGVVLGFLPGFLVGAGGWTLGDDAMVLAGWSHVAPHGFIPQVFFLGMLPLGIVAGPWLLKAHARVASSLLAPTRTEMAARVSHTVTPASPHGWWSRRKRSASTSATSSPSSTCIPPRMATAAS